MLNRKYKTIRYLCIAGCLFTALFISSNIATALIPAQKAVNETSKEEKAGEKPKSPRTPPAGPADEYDRGAPRTSIKGFLDAGRDGNFKRAAKYLDLRDLPQWMDKSHGPKLARQFKIILDRALWIDLELISNNPDGMLEDGLPSIRESLGRIKIEAIDKSVDILLQQVPRESGVYIWKISNRTVAEIPYLYAQFGYSPFEEKLSEWFPDFVFLRWQSWQWGALLFSIILAYLIVFLPTWSATLVLCRRETEMSLRLKRFITEPVRVTLWILFVWIAILIIAPSVTIRYMLRAGTLATILAAWFAMRLIDLLLDWWVDRLRRSDRESVTVLISPFRPFVKAAVILLALLLWLDNIGFDVTTLLAGLGVGGIAIALAVQDTLKNLLGSIMVLIDKPYQVGQRIVVKGHDGVVEEIGLRTTKIRLLTGHQTTVPNEQMTGTDIENIGRRPHIRRLTNITIPYDTAPERVEKALNIIRDILDNHEGMDPEFSPRVHFNEFNPASLNILVLYWYHPPDYWGFLQFSEKVNLQIMQEFSKEGIRFALPTTTTYLTQDDGRSLQIDVAGNSQTASQGALV